MASELQIQGKIVIPFFTDKLGYEFKSSNTIGESLIIDSDVRRFLELPINISATERVIKTCFGGDADKFYSAYCEELSRAAFKSHNVAIFLKKCKWKFRGEEFVLWSPSGSSFGDRDSSQDNIFSITEELVFSPVAPLMKGRFNRRVDIALFLNGIFFGYIELKHQNTQLAIDKGRQKVIANYVNAVEVYDIQGQEDFDLDRALSLFERSIFISASDLHETYVIRDLGAMRAKARAYIKDNTGNINQFINDQLKLFPLYPSDKKVDKDGLEAKMHEDYTNLYSKKSIENEILYYNYLESKIDRIKQKETDTASRINNGQKLITPRPKQKFGVDKVIRHVVELYKHEANPNYLADSFRQKLSQMDIGHHQIEHELKGRLMLNNNNAIYSVITQYAAGFGKTKLMCWQAAQLNELKESGSHHLLFDKIIMVSDRLDLRNQISETIATMPSIQKGAWTEATDTEQFIAALENALCRVIAVNVQKFNFLAGKMDGRIKHLVSEYRVAFVVDEIHRSHSGKQNDCMVELFESIGSASNIDKKNLIIGLTATPSDAVLQRYGEIGHPTSDGFHFKPLDSFTMKEAIAGGYVFNPLASFIPIIIPTFIEESDSTGVNRLPGPDEYYNHEERIKKVIDHAWDAVNSITFKKIRNKGKAMYVAHSINAAIIAFKYFEKKVYEKYGDSLEVPEISICYSKSGDQRQYVDARSLNGGRNEEKVIQDFKNSKNAIIVVVDKLQTGFDEPTLHTIILNTERKGINMVQTLCRINRTVKHKEDCMVLDYSVIDQKSGKTKNELNAKEAFNQYCEINTSILDPNKRFHKMRETYDSMLGGKTYSDLYPHYLKSKNNPEYDVTVFGPAVKSTESEDINHLFQSYYEFSNQLNTLAGVAMVDDKFKNPLIPDFISKVRSLISSAQAEKMPLSFTVSDIEGWSVHTIKMAIERDGNERTGSASLKRKEEDEPQSQIDSLKAKIKELNEFNLMTELEINENNDRVLILLNEILQEPKNTGVSAGLIAKLLDNKDQDLSTEFARSLKNKNRRASFNFPGETPEEKKEAKAKFDKFVMDLSDYYYSQFKIMLYRRQAG